MLKNPEMLQAYRNGETSAFLALYEKHHTPLRRFLHGGFNFSSQGRICRFKGADSSIDVESLVQETFTRAFAKTTRDNYDGIRPFQTYLFSIAKNLVLRECYHRDRMIQTDFLEETESAESGNLFNNSLDNPEKKAQNNQLQLILRNFINTLNSEEKLFFSSRFAKGLTQEATATDLCTTRARIKLLEKNIRKRFLELLRSRGYFINYVPNPRWKRKMQPENNLCLKRA